MRGGFNWKLWALLGGGTEVFLIISATSWAPSQFTYFLAVLFLPVMVLTAFWSRKYFLLDQEKQALSHRADRNLQEMARFFETATAVSNLSKLGENLTTLGAKLAELLDVEICGFFLYQEGLESLIAPTPPSGLREDRLFNQMRLNQLRFAANASTLIGRIFVTQEPLIILDCRHDFEASQLLPEQFGFRDMLLVPLGAAGRPVGVLMLANKRHEPFSAYDVKLAASLGSEVAVSIENTMLFEQTREQAQRLDASIEMLRHVSQALTVTNPGSLLRAVVQAVRALSGAPACLITLSNGGAELQSAEVSDGFDPALEGRSFRQLSPGILTQVVLEQRAIFSEDLKQDARFPSDSLADQYGLHAALAVPMFLQKELVGTLSLFYLEPRPFDPTLMQVLQILATQTAVALDNARRYQRERETIEMLRRANVELQEADRMKSEFLTNLSHELRTPLNAIIGFSEILHTMPDLSADERAEFSDDIHRSGRRLLKLINDLLDLTTIRAGRLILQPEACLVAEAVDAALSENAPAANQKNLTVHSEVPRGLRVTFDPRSLRHIVYNLVNNAIKFTPQHGSVIVTAAGTPEGTVVEVRDTGIGIRTEDQTRLFAEFRQLDGSTSRAFEGTGLGLVLSKRLVEMQGGRIWVESVPGRGSSFRFLIPSTPTLARVA
jgi:signal transduction histidine kinase